MNEKSGNYSEQFTSVIMDDMLDLEKCFNFKILIYSLSPDGVVCNLYKSVNNYANKMCLNLHKNNLSYIVDINKFAQNNSLKSASNHLQGSGTCKDTKKYAMIELQITSLEASINLL